MCLVVLCGPIVQLVEIIGLDPVQWKFESFWGHHKIFSAGMVKLVDTSLWGGDDLADRESSNLSICTSIPG